MVRNKKRLTIGAQVRRRGPAQGGRKRRAFSLVEMLVVVALSTILLGVVMTLLQGLIKRDRGARNASLHSQQLAELAELLRTDIRRGTDVSLAGEEALIVQSSSGERIKYDLDSVSCQRTVSPAGPGKALTDRLAIGLATAWRVRRETSGNRPLVTVTLERIAAEDRQTPTAPLLVCAALGADAASRVVPDPGPSDPSL